MTGWPNSGSRAVTKREVSMHRMSDPRRSTGHVAGRVGVISLLAAFVSLAVFGGPAEAGLTAQQKRRLCFPAGSTTTRISHDARVYTISDVETRLRACLFSTGRSRTLAEYDGILTFASARALVGRFVAWDYERLSNCRDQCPTGVERGVPTQALNVTDLRTGRRLSADTRAAKVGVTTQGALVWLTFEGAAGATLRVLDGRGQRIIDSGAVDETFLRVFSTFVLWRKGGQNHWLDLAG